MSDVWVMGREGGRESCDFWLEVVGTGTKIWGQR